VFHSQVDVVGTLLLNASLLVLATDYSDWLLQVTELIDNDGIFWVLTIVWLNNTQLINYTNLLILLDKWYQVLKIKEMNACCLFVMLVKIFKGINFLITTDSVTR